MCSPFFILNMFAQTIPRSNIAFEAAIKTFVQKKKKKKKNELMKITQNTYKEIANHILNSQHKLRMAVQ